MPCRSRPCNCGAGQRRCDPAAPSATPEPRWEHLIKLNRSTVAALVLAAIGTTALPAPAGKSANGVGNAKLGACSVSDLTASASACLDYGISYDSAAELAALVGGAGWNGLVLSTLTPYQDALPVAVGFVARRRH